jgi:hypothetical protein
MKNALRQLHPQHQSNAVNQRSSEVAASIPNSEALSSFDAFCTPEYDLHHDTDDPLEGYRLAQEQLERAIQSFREAHPTPEQQLVALEAMALWADQYGIRTTDSAAPFIQLLCQSPDFRSAFIDHVLNDPNPQLGF